MRNLSELHHEAMSLKLIKTELHVGSYTKEQLMDLLAVSHREHDVTGRPTLLPQLSVMLARNVKDLDEHLFDGMLNNKDQWIAEEKLDGMRAKLHLISSGHNRIDSKHRSDVTYEYVEKTDCLPHLRDLKHNFPGTVLDGELIMPAEKIKNGKTDTDSVLTSTLATVNSHPERAKELQRAYGYCRYYMFDMLFLNGKDIRAMAYRQRYKLVRELQNYLFHTNSGNFVRLPVRRGNCFGAFYKDQVDSGGEGIMLKRLDWPYESGKPSKGMYKWKKQKFMDCFVTGFVPGKGEFSGLVGALLVSVIGRGRTTREVAAIQPGDLHYRKLISEADGSLCDGIYGKVVEVAYLCETKNERLRHAVLRRWRPDKTMYDCKGE